MKNLIIDTTRPGYISLREDVDRDIREEKESADKRGHTYSAEESEKEKKFKWAIERAQHYADKTDMDANDILDAWEASRDYWYINYYQEAKQPAFKDGSKVHIFENRAAAVAAFVKREFRCPACGGISTDPQTCDSGKKIKRIVCDWKSWGFLGTMGKGVTIFMKDSMDVIEIFTPVAWEKPEPTGEGKKS